MGIHGPSREDVVRTSDSRDKGVPPRCEKLSYALAAADPRDIFNDHVCGSEKFKVDAVEDNRLRTFHIDHDYVDTLVFLDKVAEWRRSNQVLAAAIHLHVLLSHKLSEARKCVLPAIFWDDLDKLHVTPLATDCNAMEGSLSFLTPPPLHDGKRVECYSTPTLLLKKQAVREHNWIVGPDIDEETWRLTTQDVIPEVVVLPKLGMVPISRYLAQLTLRTDHILGVPMPSGESQPVQHQLHADKDPLSRRIGGSVPGENCLSSGSQCFQAHRTHPIVGSPSNQRRVGDVDTTSSRSTWAEHRVRQPGQRRPERGERSRPSEPGPPVLMTLGFGRVPGPARDQVPSRARPPRRRTMPRWHWARIICARGGSTLATEPAEMMTFR